MNAASYLLENAQADERHLEETGRPTPADPLKLAIRMREILCEPAFDLHADLRVQIFPATAEVTGAGQAIVRFADGSSVTSNGSGSALNWHAHPKS